MQTIKRRESQTPNALYTTADAGGKMVSVEGLALPLRYVEIEARAHGGLARIRLKQIFSNPHDRPLLVRYQLPLPVDGVVSGFQFSFGGQKIFGEVEGKQRARERFEQALISGRVASLLEEQRANQFEQKVGNVPPKEAVVCEVFVDQKLKWLPEGGWEWRFPTTIGVRYMGRKGRVSDAEALQVSIAQQELTTKMQISLSIEDELREGVLPSAPSHEIESREEGGDVQVCFSAAKGVALDRDVVVRWQIPTPEVGISWRTCRTEEGHRAGERCFGLMSITPPGEEVGCVPVPRDLIVLLDTSGSMSGGPLQQACTLVCALIGSLGGRDQLELIAFGSVARRWREGSVAVTDDIKRAATSWVMGLKASGGTEMRHAIYEAVRPLRDDSLRQVVLITDGYVGFEEEIVSTIAHQLPSNSRIHVVGVGSSVNRALTEPVARVGRGVELVLGLDEPVEAHCAQLLVRTNSPMVTDLVLEGPTLFSHFPSKLPDCYAGAPCMLSFELPLEGGTLRLRGKMAGRTLERELLIEPSTLKNGSPAIASLFAREQIQDLELKKMIVDEHSQIDEMIEAIGLSFQVASRLTSWIAVQAESSAREPGEPWLEQEMPHELPHGISIEGLGLRAPARLERTTSLSFDGMMSLPGVGYLLPQGPANASFGDQPFLGGRRESGRSIYEDLAPAAPQEQKPFVPPPHEASFSLDEDMEAPNLEMLVADEEEMTFLSDSTLLSDKLQASSPKKRMREMSLGSGPMEEVSGVEARHKGSGWIVIFVFLLLLLGLTGLLWWVGWL